jgi:hypothetical protein
MSRRMFYVWVKYPGTETWTRIKQELWYTDEKEAQEDFHSGKRLDLLGPLAEGFGADILLAGIDPNEEQEG